MLKMSKRNILCIVLVLAVLFQMAPLNMSNVYAANSDIVRFNDDQLEQTVRYQLNKSTGDITRGDMLKLKTFSLVVRNVKDLTGLEYATNLESLNLVTNQISDLTPLTNLTKLKSLMLIDNNIVDLSPLSGLKNLENIELSDNKVVDLAPLSDLTNLRKLTLNNNKITDISALKKLTKLTTLDLSYNTVSDITSVKEMTELTELTLSSNKIESVESIKGLTKLNSLALAHNNITDIAPLSGLVKLEQLYLTGNKVKDLTPLKGLNTLKELEVSENLLTDVSVVTTSLKNLEIFYANSNKITAIPEFAAVKTLKQLALNNNKISDIKNLSKYKSLVFIDLSSNEIKDITVLKSLATTATNKIYGLYLPNNFINVDDPATKAVLETLMKAEIPYTIMPQRSESDAKSFDVTIEMNIDGAGNISGAGTYKEGSKVAVSATPATGYRFENWTVNGKEVSKKAEYTFTITKDTNLVANFVKKEVAQKTYKVTVKATPANAGKVAGAGSYKEGTKVAVSATPATGYRFENWTVDGDEVSKKAEYTFTITKDTNLVANFVKKEVVAKTYKVTVKATPANGGKVAGAGSYKEGTKVAVTATPATGYRFENWTVNGKEVSKKAEYTFTIAKDTNLVANFVKKEVVVKTYKVTVKATPANAGKVTGAGSYKEGTKVAVTATPVEGYRFENWTVDGDEVSQETEYTFTITEDVDLVANFVKEETDEDQNNEEDHDDYQVEEELLYVGFLADFMQGYVEGEGYYTKGEEVTVQASPNYNFEFKNWTVNGKVVSTDEEYTFKLTDDIILEANFVEVVEEDHEEGDHEEYDETAGMEYPCYVDAKASIREEGYVEGAGYYNEGDKATITAFPEYGYKFSNWSLYDEVVSADAEYTFTVTDNTIFYANFVEDETATH